MSKNRKIGLLYDSVSPNTGDIAIGIAAQQILAGLGVEGIAVDPFAEEKSSPLIIGGGELIRTSGDDFYDRFKVPGHHILNAAGVWNNADNLDYLKEYAFVSARSTREAETLSKWVPDVKVVPCATTLLKSDKYEIKGIDFSEPVVGIHLAPHSIRVIEELVDIVDSIPHQKVFIPFTHYNGDASFMAQMPFNRERTVTLGKLSPLELHSVFGQMTYSLTTSMHASIFSYSQGVPFVSIYQEKVFNYFSDRGLQDFVVKDYARLKNALEKIQFDIPEMELSLEKDRLILSDLFARYVEINGEFRTTGLSELSTTTESKSIEAFMREQQLSSLKDHDLTIAILENRRRELSVKYSALEEKFNKLAHFFPIRAALKIRSLFRK